MNLRWPRILLLSVAIGIPHALRGQDGVTGDLRRAAESPVVKCGRDSVYLVCQRLGVPATLDEIDHDLEYRDEVSLADVRAFLEKKRLFCHAVWLERPAFSRLSSVIHNLEGVRSAIVALPQRGSQIRHFAIVLDASADSLTVMNTDTAMPVQLDLDAILDDRGIPVLLVGTDKSVYAALNEGSSAYDVLLSTASSTALTAGLLMFLAMLTLRPLWRRGSRFVRTLRLGGFVPRPRILAGCTVGAAAIASIGYLAVCEVRPLVVDVHEIDFGSCPVGSGRTASVRLLNRSFFRAVELNSVRASCSCIDVSCDRDVIPSRASSIVRAAMMVSSLGRAEYKLLVMPKGSSSGIAVTVRATGYESTRFTPAYFNIGQFPRGVAAERRFKLHIKNCHADQPIPLDVSQSTGSSPALDVALGDSNKLAKNGVVELVFRSSGAQPLGMFLQKITLTTVESTPRTFVVVAHGDIVDAFSVEPRAAFVSSSRYHEESITPIVIRSRAGPLQVRMLSIDTDAISATLKAAADDAVERVIELRSNGQTVPASRATLRIEVLHPHQTMEVPIYARPAVAE